MEGPRLGTSISSMRWCRSLGEEIDTIVERIQEKFTE